MQTLNTTPQGIEERIEKLESDKAFNVSVIEKSTYQPQIVLLAEQNAIIDRLIELYRSNLKEPKKVA